MPSAHSSASLRYTQLIIPLLLCQFVTSVSAKAQVGNSQSVGGRHTDSKIVVFVHSASGDPLTTSALVRLYSSDGMPMGQVSVGSGGQAIFRDIVPGSYSISVEANGYVAAESSAMVPITGEADIEIYLRRESEADKMVLSGSGTPVLSPNAKKELDKGAEALRKKNLKEAEVHLEKAISLAPMHPEVLYTLGTLYAQKNDLPRAEGLLLKATQMEPQQARTQAALGIVLANELKFEAALVPLGKALELDAGAWEARWALARCNYHARKFQSALEQSRQALQDSKGLGPDIALLEAASLVALRQYEESAALLREYLQEHADRPGAARARRWLDHLQQAGKIKPA
jgi:Tfp pilus assembly protein PilF